MPKIVPNVLVLLVVPHCYALHRAGRISSPKLHFLNGPGGGGVLQPDRAASPPLPYLTLSYFDGDVGPAGEREEIPTAFLSLSLPTSVRYPMPG